MSQALVKLQRKGQRVIPRSLREEAGVAEGMLMKVSPVSGRRFLLTPQFTVDRSLVEDSGQDKKQLLRELAQIVSELMREAKGKGLSDISRREIDAAVASARKGRRKPARVVK